MDWSLAIEVNRRALLRLLRLLVAGSGLVPGGTVALLPRRVRSKVFDFLIPAEAAVRRLIVVLAQGMTIPLREGGDFPSGGVAGKGGRGPVFGLVDPIRRAGPPSAPHPKGAGPRVVSLDEPFVAGAVEAASPDDALDATRLCRRLTALHGALDDLPAQARRLVLWKARGERLRHAGRWARVSPLRSGRPPGYRARWRHPVDAVLTDCHELAMYALAHPGARV